MGIVVQGTVEVFMVKKKSPSFYTIGQSSLALFLVMVILFFI